MYVVAGNVWVVVSLINYAVISGERIWAMHEWNNNNEVLVLINMLCGEHCEVFVFKCLINEYICFKNQPTVEKITFDENSH